MPGDVQIPASALNHPFLVLVFVGAVSVFIIARFGREIIHMMAPLGDWWSQRSIRRLERQGRLEQAAEALNDQRNRLLSVQLAGVSAQLEAVLRQAREDAERHHEEITSLRAQLTATQLQLDEAMKEIAQLRAELATYRGERDR